MNIRDLEQLKIEVNKDNVNLFIDEFGRNLLQNAIIDNPKAIDFLLELGVNINHSDNNGENALHYSVLYDDYNSSKKLLDLGIEKDKKNIYGNNPMWVAVFEASKINGTYDIVRLLKQYECDCHSKNHSDRSPLDFALQIGDEELCKILSQ